MDSGKSCPEKSVGGNEARIGFHDRTAGFAGAQAFGIVKMFEMRQEIFFDIVELEVDFVEFVVAFFAEPEQAVCKSSARADAFDDQPDGVFRTNRRMGRMRGMEVHIAGVELEFLALAFVLNDDFYGAFELVKKLFGFVVMVVFTGVWTGYDHDDIVVAERIDVLVADRWF